MSLRITKTTDGKEVISRSYPVGLGPVYELFTQFGWKDARGTSGSNMFGISFATDLEDGDGGDDGKCGWIDEYVFTKRCCDKLRQFRIRIFTNSIEVVVPILSKDYSYTTTLNNYYDMTEYIEQHLFIEWDLYGKKATST